MRQCFTCLIVALLVLVTGCGGRTATSGDQGHGGGSPQTVDIAKLLHTDIINKYFSDKTGWYYYSFGDDLKISEVIRDKHLCTTFGRLLHVDLNNKYLEVGDRVPFILVSPSGTQVLVVYIKAQRQSLLVVPLVVDQGEWKVERVYEISVR